LPFASVGATENLIMAASLAKGVTILNNAAREPEIVDLANCLNKCGAKIQGAGTSIIIINGVERLNSASHTVMYDRIEAGTYALLGAIIGQDLTLKGCVKSDNEALFNIIEQSNAQIQHISHDTIIVSAPKKGDFLKSVPIKTEPYPGFPTDLQAQYMATMCFADKPTEITENIFENRFMHVPELRRMNANIKIEGNKATITPTYNLSGTEVMATDLRASVSLVIAALVAQGETVINRLYHLDRGYERLEEKLMNVGAVIKREQQQAKSPHNKYRFQSNIP
jgi:UDP-N-acetylglucosamine 1-carboxyvinyltransferase